MQDHYHFSDEEFIERFSNCSLDPDLFDHEAHMRLAWLNITNNGIESAIKITCNQLKAFTDHIGESHIYNITVTIAALKIIDHFIRMSSSMNFKEFILEFPRLKTNFKDVLAFHYKTDIFNSERAKKEFIEPELAPFK